MRRHSRDAGLETLPRARRELRRLTKHPWSGAERRSVASRPLYFPAAFALAMPSRCRVPLFMGYVFISLDLSRDRHAPRWASTPSAPSAAADRR